MKNYLVAAILLAATFFAKAQCPATLNDLLAGGTFNDGGVGCNYVAPGAIATLGNINFTGSLTISGVTTFTVAHDITWNGGLFDIQGNGNVLIGNGTMGSLSIMSGTVRSNDASSGSFTVQANSTISVSTGSTLQSYSTIFISQNATVNNSGTISNAAGGLTVNGSLYTSTSSTITSVGNTTINSTGSLTMDQGSSISTTGNIILNGELRSDGSMTSTGTLTVNSTATFDITSNGSIQSTSMNINAGGAASNQGTLIASAGLTLGGNFTNSGTISSSSGTSDITITGTVSNSGQITAIDDIIVTATGVFTISATGTMSAEDFTIHANGSMTVEAGGSVTTTGTDDNTIAGTLITSGNFTLNGDLVVTGASAHVTVNGGVLSITRPTDGDLEVTAGGTFMMNGGTLNIPDDITTQIDGGVASTANITINSGSTVNVVDDVIVTGGSFQNNGTLSSDDIDVSGGSFHNTGAVTVNDGNVDLFGGSFENDGSLSITGDINITGGNFYNDENISVDDIFVTAPGTLTSHEAGATITLADQYADGNCPYADGIYHFCSCIGNPPDADGVSAMCASALPIELLNFSGDQHGNEIQLKWTTATETNNYFFTIEKLTAKDIFEEVVHVPGAGTTVTEQHYSAFDPNPVVGNNYYRLKQTDYDGKSSRSELIKVSFQSNTIAIQVFPNPASGSTVTVRVHGAAPNQQIQVALQNLVGQALICAHPRTDQFGSAEIDLSISGFSAGVYLILAEGKSKKLTIH